MLSKKCFWPPCPIRAAKTIPGRVSERKFAGQTGLSRDRVTEGAESGCERQGAQWGARGRKVNRCKAERKEGEAEGSQQMSGLLSTTFRSPLESLAAAEMATSKLLAHPLGC